MRVEPPKDWRSSLRLTFAFILSAMVAITAAGILVLSHVNARHNALVVSGSIIGQVAGVTHERVRAFLLAPQTANALAVADLKSGVLDPSDRAELEARLFDTLSVYPSLAMMGYADEAGRFLMVKRMGDGSLATKDISLDEAGVRRVVWRHRAAEGGLTDVTETKEDPNDTYDPRVRPWYVGAKDSGVPFFTDVYVFFTDKAPGVTASVPYEAGGLTAGVVAVDISLARFSKFLAELQVSEHGRAFLIDPRGRLIASPDPADLVVETETAGKTELALKAAAESRDPALAAIAALPEFAGAIAGEDDVTLRFATPEGPHLAVLRPITAGDDRWTIAVLAPEEDFLADVNRANRQNIAVALAFTGVAMLASLLIARWISSSLQLLVVESGRLRDLRFDDPIDFRTPFHEVYDVLKAFSQAKTGLRTFQKYMPIKLVRILLEQETEPGLGGEEMEVTVYFSDIAGFTTVSEQLGPMEMAKRLGHYLGSLSAVISDRQGTVVQYVGDQIMAFWGAPLPVANHAEEACRSALACSRATREMFPGDPVATEFPTRFGIHTCRVAVGHYGSPDRMYYGAIGDGVNLTSRLEGANKHYGSEILVSEDTVAIVRELFEFRKLDVIVAKGKVRPIGIYELLGEKGAVDAALLEARDAYEAGFAHYLDRRWREATRAFEGALRLRPGDLAAETLIERCRAYAADPPPDAWSGAWVMKTK